MNTTLTHRPLFKNTRHAIGANTSNVTFNIPDRAEKVLNDIAKPNRSAFIRQWIAEGIQRKDTWAGLAFRAAIGLRSFTQSIFSNRRPEELAPIFEADLESQKAGGPSVSPGEKVIAECVDEFADEGNFIPARAKEMTKMDFDGWWKSEGKYHNCTCSAERLAQIAYLAGFTAAAAIASELTGRARAAIKQIDTPTKGEK